MGAKAVGTWWNGAAAATPKIEKKLPLSATVCHANISEIHFNLPHQYFRASINPVPTDISNLSTYLIQFAIKRKKCK